MTNKLERAGALAVCFFLACGTAQGHGGGGGGGFHGGGGFSGGGGFHGGGLPGGGSFHGGLGGLPAGGWHGGGGIAGGGWHAGGLTGGLGGFSGIGPGIGHSALGRLPSASYLPGIGGAGFAARNSAWHGGLAGYGAGLGGGFPGRTAFWSYAHPYSWYNGHWHNHWYGNGFGGYWGLGYPLAWGLGGWGLGGWGLGGWGLGGWGMGNLWYSSGYSPYYNPYYAPGMVAAYNYAQPIPVPTLPPAGMPNDANGGLANAGNPDVDLAIEKFRAGDYAGALALVDGVIRVAPSDAAAHELRGLILFAVQDYSQSAATLHSVLAVGPGWDWTTLSSLYPDMQVYQGQFQALVDYVQLHPQQADARFVLAYHDLTQGHTAEAKEQLQAVVRLMPKDKLAANLLAMAGGGGQSPAADPPPAVNPPPPSSTTPIDPAVIAGDWHARRDDGSTFDLTLSPDKTFAWNFKQQDQNQAITGTYTLDNSILVLQGENGGPNNGAMVAQLSDVGANGFTFKALGGPSDDPGLSFRR